MEDKMRLDFQAYWLILLRRRWWRYRATVEEEEEEAADASSFYRPRHPQNIHGHL
jgi:hypothetical protein